MGRDDKMETDTSQDRPSVYMNDFEKQVIETLTELKTLITEDHKILRGNGHPGLIDRVAALEGNQGMVKGFKDLLDMAVALKVDVELLKNNKSWWRGVIVDGIAALCAMVTIYCAFFK